MANVVWDVPVGSIFQYVLKFYRREKEHIHLEYSQRIQLLALFKQVKLGCYSQDKDTGTGYFDMVGADRRKAWRALGNLSKEDAQTEIVKLLEGVCPQLQETVLNDYNGTERQFLDNRLGSHHVEEDVIENNGRRQEVVGVDSESGGYSPSASISASSSSPPASSPVFSSKQQQQQKQGEKVVVHTVLAPAALWCSPKTAKNFIAELLASLGPGSSGPLTLAPGETVSVQVPTSPKASAIFWEFATEHGDIGFGLDFEDSEHKYCEQLLPATVRSCQEDLVLGSHQYQDHGVYTLTFVNTHTTLPITVYYKVFYQTSS